MDPINRNMVDAREVYVQDRGPAVLAVTCLVIILSTLFVVLRLVSRIAIVRQVNSDDYWMVTAWVSDGVHSTYVE